MTSATAQSRPGRRLAELDPGTIASDVLSGIRATADRERSGIFSTAARVLRAYRSPAAPEASRQPSFNPQTFVASKDTIYIACPPANSNWSPRSSSAR